VTTAVLPVMTGAGHGDGSVYVMVTTPLPDWNPVFMFEVIADSAT
jgi:hypothetical protein